MTSAIVATRRYLTRHRNSFWKWRDQGDVFCWNDGRVIAFREELVAVLERLTPEGLPSLRSVLLVLAATRSNWNEGPADATPLWDRLQQTSSTYEDERIFRVVVDQLDGVSQLPKSERESLPAKCALVESIFEGLQRHLSPETSAAVVSHLAEFPQHVFGADAPLLPSGRGEDEDFNRDIAWLSFGLLGVSRDALNLRRETGLDSLPVPAEVELSPVDKIRTLLISSKDDPELSGVVALASRLMAAVTLPRPVSAVDDLQMGGVSDISHRGPLDRLLLSELAHEELTLAVRVAMNEALYLRRESPPKAPATRRVLLLDAGIRTWGLPRAFATSVALALAATARPDSKLSVYRANGRALDEVDLGSREGLVAHLGVLHHDIHPGHALEAFLQRVDECQEQVEAVIITTADTLADASFQSELRKLEPRPLLFAAVDRAGHVQLSERSRAGSKRLKEARLDLQVLCEQPATPRHSLVDPAVKDLPAIFSCDPFPLRLPAPPNVRTSVPLEAGGLLGITKDRRLLWWDHRRRGAIQLAANMPCGEIWWSTSNSESRQAEVIVSEPDGTDARYVAIDLTGSVCRTVHLELENRPLALLARDGILFAIQESHVWILSMATGEKVGSILIPAGVEWVRGRFFKNHDAKQWLVPTFDGSQGRFSVVLDERRDGCPNLVALVDCPYREGVVGIAESGSPYFSDRSGNQDSSRPVRGRARVFAVDPREREVAVVTGQADPTRTPATIINMIDESTEVRTITPRYFAEAAIARYVGHASVRHRFRGIYVDQRGLLSLVSAKHQRVAIAPNHSGSHIELAPRPQPDGPGELREFTDLHVRKELGFQLRKAHWDDESEAYLDSRGLLHLRSSNRSLPEVSIALIDGNELGGWSSDGRLWGSPIVTGPKPSVSSFEVYCDVIRAFVERLP